MPRVCVCVGGWVARLSRCVCVCLLERLLNALGGLRRVMAYRYFHQVLARRGNGGHRITRHEQFTHTHTHSQPRVPRVCYEVSENMHHHFLPQVVALFIILILCNTIKINFHYFSLKIIRSFICTYFSISIGRNEMSNILNYVKTTYTCRPFETILFFAWKTNKKLLLR